MRGDLRSLGHVVLLCGLMLVGTVLPAQAELNLPGLFSDAAAYQRTLARRSPNGATTAQRAQSEAQAEAARRAGDATGEAAALETRIGQGQAEPGVFLRLAQAQLRRTPPQPVLALEAAALAYQRFPEADRVVPLLVMADALRILDRRVQQIDVLREAAELAPINMQVASALRTAQREAGMLVRANTREGDSDPPRACLSFTVAPTRKRDFQPQDWVSLEPKIPGYAVTLEGEQICVSGLPSGKTTTIVLRAGLPGEGGVDLARDTRVAISMPNRAPAIAFDTRMFVLPRGQARAVSINTVNLSTVSLRLIRLSERNVALLLKQIKLGEALDYWNATNLAEEAGREVWRGRADIPGFAANQLQHTALALPDAMQTAGPGIYALIATAGDGTPLGEGATQLILRTDLAPTLWRGQDGLTVQLRDYATAQTRPGVQLRLMARNNDILAEDRTDAAGVAHFATALLHGAGGAAPAFVQMFTDDGDFATLDLNAAAFDLSDRGVTGVAPPGPMDGYAWTERGIYRPGETVNVTALLRDAAGAPLDVPAHLVVRKPNGALFQDNVPPDLGEGARAAAINLPPSAPTGVWSVSVVTDPDAAPIARVEFRVDAFVPERLAVEAGPGPAVFDPARETVLPVAARFLYGAAGSGLSGHAALRLVPDPAPFPALQGAQIGQEGEVFAPDQTRIDLPETDAQGHTSATFKLDAVPDTTQALKAEIDVSIDDQSGHASHADVTLPVRPSGPMIGIVPKFADRAVNASSEAAFDIGAVDPNGKRIALPVRLRLVRERPDWRMVTRDGAASYQIVWRDEPLETQDVTLQAGEWTHFARSLPFGRYRLEALQTGGLALTTLRFRSGWADNTTPDVPDKVDVSTDRKMALVGESVHVHIAPPFEGEATIAVLTDRVHALRTLHVPQAGADLDVAVDAAWGPGAYVAVHMFRPGPKSARAIGIAYIAADPAERLLPLSIEAPEQTAPRHQQEVVLHTAPGAMVSLEAVDEGILRLTRFQSPDPGPHFLGRRRLGIDIRDDWGRLIAPPDGPQALLRQGGDDAGFVLPEIPQHILSLHSQPIRADAQGVARIRLDVPDFAGQVRLMAVSWQGRRFAARQADMIIRDPVVAEMLLPRFLAPGDEANMAVLLQNLDLAEGVIGAKLSVDGPLAFVGDGVMSATLAPGARALPASVLRATGIGRGVVHLAVTGPGGFSVVHEAAITVRPARPMQSLVQARELAAGQSMPVDPGLARFVPGTGRAWLSAGAPVRFDAQAIRAELDAYPLFCLEQASSKGLALAMQAGAPESLPKLQEVVQRILDKQRYDGGFGLWSGNGPAEPWLSAYAMDVLLRARDAGVAVPEPAIEAGLKFLGQAADAGDEQPVVQAYRLYVLARAGRGRPGAARVMLSNIEQVPTRLARAQLGAAFALAQDRARAEAAFGAAILLPNRDWQALDYGSSLRDQMALIVLLRESGVMADRLPGLLAQLPGADLVPARMSTQEMAWSDAAASVLERNQARLALELDGTTLSAAEHRPVRVSITAPGVVHNSSDAPVWVSVAATGVPVRALPAGRAGLRVSRHFYDLNGKPLDPGMLRQNAVFVLVLEGHIDDGQRHTLALSQGLPAGWEVVGRIALPDDGGAVAGMAWLDRLSPLDAEPGADDRYVAIVTTDPKQTDFRVAVRLRATTQGSFALPGAALDDMARPAYFAREAEGRIKVLPP